MKTKTLKVYRVSACNMLLRKIASTGRHFFRHNNDVSCFQVDARGRIWFVDAYALKAIYMHNPGNWRGFSEGGTLQQLVISMFRYIQNETPIGGLGPWPETYCNGDPWGYGLDMEDVRYEAMRLNLLSGG